MKTHALTALAFLFSSLISHAQFTYDWAKRIAGGSTDWAYDITTDEDRNVITSGTFVVEADMDPSNGSEVMLYEPTNAVTAFLSKLDENGNYGWAIALDGPSTGKAVVTDDLGNIYFAGTFLESFDFDRGPFVTNINSAGETDAFISKFTPNGDLVWVKTFGAANHDGIVRLDINDQGEIIACGYFSYTVDFDPGEGTTELTAFEPTHVKDAFVAKFDTDGNFHWVHHFGGASTQLTEDVVFDSQDNVVVTGRFSTEMNCDPGVSDFSAEYNGDSDYDAYVAKLNNNGDFLWVKSVGSNDNDIGYGLAVDDNDNIIYSGQFGNTVDFDPGEGVSALVCSDIYTDSYISKLDSDGNFIWVKQIVSDASDIAYALDVDEQGNIYSTGYTGGICDFDPGPDSVSDEWEGVADVYISVLDPDGNYMWGQNFGSTDMDWANAITVRNEHIYVTGVFSINPENTANFGDFNLTSIGNFDIFVFKLSYDQGNAVNNQSDLSIVLYPNPANETIRLQTNWNTVSSNGVLTINDVSGKIVLQVSNFNLNNELNVSGLPAGVYSVNIAQGKQVSHQKMVVVR